MAFVDDPNENSEAQVAGSTPLGQQSAPMAETPENTAQQAASQPMGAPQAESQPKGTSTGRTAPKASSGMFNNINKYVEKNKPQAQEMATAVSQDFGKKAREIQQNAAQKQQAQAQGLKANQQTLDTNRKFADDQVKQIMNPTQAPQAPQAAEGAETPQPVVYNPSQQDADRFQNLMRGKIEGVNQVQDLNLAQQNVRAGALQQLADTAGTEQGRRNMLGETFRKQGEYTRGMSGLDNLITSGDEQAREGLIQGVQDQAGDLTSGLSTMQTEAGRAKMAQDLAISNFGTDISNLSGEQRDMLDGQMKAALEAELTGRAGLTDEFGAASTSADAYLQNQLGQIQGTAYGDTLSGLTEAAYNNSGIRSRDSRPTNLEAFANAIKAGGDGSDMGTYSRNRGRSVKTGFNTYTNRGNTMDKVQTGWHKNRKTIGSLINELNKKFAGNELYDVDKSATVAAGDKRGNKTFANLANSQKFYEDQYKALGSGSDVVGGAVQGLAGQSLEDYVAGQGLDQYDVAEQGDVDRYNALQRLIGGEDVIDDTRRQTDFTKQDSIQALLDKYKNS